MSGRTAARHRLGTPPDARHLHPPRPHGLLLRLPAHISATHVPHGHYLGDSRDTLTSPARIHLYEARDLTCGPQELTPAEQDFKLAWWPMDQALDAAAEGRFLLPAGPLALLLAERTAFRG